MVMSVFHIDYLLKNDSFLKNHEIKNIDFGYFILFGVNLVVIVSFILLTSFLGYEGMDSGQFDISEFKNGLVIFSIMTVLVVPAFEEFIHRSFILKRKNILWSFVFV